MIQNTISNTRDNIIKKNKTFFKNTIDNILKKLYNVYDFLFYITIINFYMIKTILITTALICSTFICKTSFATESYPILDGRIYLIYNDGELTGYYYGEDETLDMVIAKAQADEDLAK